MKLYDKYKYPGGGTNEYSYFGANYKSYVSRELLSNWYRTEDKYITLFSYLDIYFDRKDGTIEICLHKPFGQHKNCGFSILSYVAGYYVTLRTIHSNQPKYIVKKMKIKLGTKAY